jgi:hypothetical protein
MTQYGIRKYNNYLILIIDEKQWLIDTGAPQSFGCGELNFSPGIVHTIPDSYMGMNIQDVCQMGQIEVDGILGVDILSRYDLLFNLPQNQLTVSQTPLSLTGIELQIEEIMNIPILEVIVNQKAVRLFFDTGAYISYTDEDILSGLANQGEIDDFLPGIGVFRTKTYLTESQLNGYKQIMKFGTSPEILQMMLMVTGTNGILGNELMLNRRVLLSHQQKKMVLE